MVMIDSGKLRELTDMAMYQQSQFRNSSSNYNTISGSNRRAAGGRGAYFHHQHNNRHFQH